MQPFPLSSSLVSFSKRVRFKLSTPSSQMSWLWYKYTLLDLSYEYLVCRREDFYTVFSSQSVRTAKEHQTCSSQTRCFPHAQPRRVSLPAGPTERPGLWKRAARQLRSALPAPSRRTSDTRGVFGSRGARGTELAPAAFRGPSPRDSASTQEAPVLGSPKQAPGPLPLPVKTQAPRSATHSIQQAPPGTDTTLMTSAVI